MKSGEKLALDCVRLHYENLDNKRVKPVTIHIPTEPVETIAAAHDYVLLEIIDNATAESDSVRKRSGFFLPVNRIQGEPNRGTVINIGDLIDSPEYSVGDTVIYRSSDIFQGFVFGGKKIVAMRHKEIIAILK